VARSGSSGTRGKVHVDQQSHPLRHHPGEVLRPMIGPFYPTKGVFQWVKCAGMLGGSGRRGERAWTLLGSGLQERTSFSPNPSRSGCSQAVLGESQYILRKSKQASAFILSESQPNARDVLKQRVIRSQALTASLVLPPVACGIVRDDSWTAVAREKGAALCSPLHAGTCVKAYRPRIGSPHAHGAPRAAGHTVPEMATNQWP
jgi:hypothetical protein